jgi:hypothetical protein
MRNTDPAQNLELTGVFFYIISTVEMEDAETQTNDVQIIEIPVTSSTLDIITEDEKENDSAPQEASPPGKGIPSVEENQRNKIETKQRIELEEFNTAL